MPERIQRKRAKGWRMPEGAVYVGRGSKWGNRYRVLPAKGGGFKVSGEGKVSMSAGDSRPWTRADAAAFAVLEYRDHTPAGSTRARDAQIQLRGCDLACWCPLDQPCHADVLLELANGGDDG